MAKHSDTGTADGDLHEKLGAVAGHTANAVMILAVGGEIEWVNPAFCAATGYALAEVLGRVPRTFLRSGENGPAVFAALDAAYACGDGATCELVNRRKNGETYWVHMDIRQLHTGPGGAHSGYVIIETDITERKAAEAEAESARRRLEVAIETLPDGFVFYDAEDRLVLCNDRYRKMYPESAAAMVPGARFEDILRHGLERGQYADGIGREEAWLAERLAAHRAADTTLEQRLGSGRWLRIVERETPDGGRVGLRIDITTQLENCARAERAEMLLRDAISSLPAAFWLFDSDDRLVMFNDRYREMFPEDDSPVRLGASYETVVRTALRQMRVFPDREDEDEAIRKLREDRKTAHYEREFQLGDGRWMRSFHEPTSDGGFVGFGIDVTELRNRQDRLKEAAATDPLTGLANRRGLSEHLEDIARRAGPATRVAMMHVDLDKFKSVNDVLGHEAGDHVLKHCADVLRRATRGDDLVARVGGDEFVVICDNAEDDRVVAMMADRFVTRLAAPIAFRDKTCHVGASVGIAHWTPASDPDVQGRLTDADIALNQAKRKGRGRYHFFEDGMRSRALLSAELAQEIYDGLRRDEFEPWFQPQFDMDGGRVSGFEALIRWNHPQRGLLAPDDFLFAAEEANLMDALDQRMLEKACSVMPELAGAGYENARISLNLTGLRLADPKIVDRVRQTAEVRGVRPDQLVLEILESALLDDRSAHVSDNINGFVDAGFTVELDDFGTGHAAIASLRKYPLERIKIDRSLVTGIDRDPELVMITSAITNLAKSLGLRVLAEGVENAAELVVLQQIGCTCVQGFFFGRPMPLAKLLDWLRDRRGGSCADRRAASA